MRSAKARRRGKAVVPDVCAPTAVPPRKGPPTEHEQAQGADESQFFSHDGKHEIGIRFGQKAELLPALAQPDAKPAAGAHRDERLVELVGNLRPVGPRRQKAGQSAHLIGSQAPPGNPAAGTASAGRPQKTASGSRRQKARWRSK